MGKNITTNGIETIDQLIIYLTKLAAAYRKSYKFCGRINTGLQITAGIMGCSAALALVPAIPIFVAIIGAAPPIVTIIINKLKIEDKKTILKMHYQRIKQLLTKARIGKISSEDKNKVIEEIFTLILEMQEDKNYIPPLETHVKEFKLNGYKEKEPLVKE